MEEPMRKKVRGFVGLVNNGNTCFMNVIIQILANTPTLKDFFLGSDLEKSDNEENTNKNGGEITMEFARTVMGLWSDECEPFQPYRLKDIVSEKATQFISNRQHDAQEFLSYLLNMLHEDLQTKPSYHTPNGYLTDKKAAEASLHRSTSLIADQFQIKIRSELVCLTCKEVSVTFDDPTKFISVPIPQPKSYISLTFFPKRSEVSRRLPVQVCRP
ncbi:ubiquitin carboxyl-terminal hydrolase 19-like [Watersipora subatra]|uniref:ubiquitin carboxyl-terminal hydrolase 19-like n=1 Tax=Watersipora subatra TaxID=2589382 RepID=UPI00355BEB24